MRGAGLKRTECRRERTTDDGDACACACVCVCVCVCLCVRVCSASRYWKGQHVILVSQAAIDENLKAAKRPKLCDPSCLQWTPRQWQA